MVRLDQRPIDLLVDMNKINKWLNQKLSSHVEGFMSAIQEQELDTKDTRKRREKNQERKQQMDIRCRVCGKHEESVYHLVCSCPVLAPTLYLDARHNQIARNMYQEIRENEKLVYNPPPVTKVGVKLKFGGMDPHPPESRKEQT